MGNIAAGAAKLPPWPARRRPEPIVRARAKQAGQRIGDLALAWNAAQEGVFELIRHILCEGDFTRARDVWIALGSDKMRLDVLAAAYPTALAKRRTLSNAVAWTVKRLRAFSEVRNDAVHIHLMNWGGELAPHFAMTKQGAQDRFAEEPWEDEVAALTGDLRAIGDYAYGIAMALRPGRPRPYVLRPELRSTTGRALLAAEQKAAADKAGRRAAAAERAARDEGRANRSRTGRGHPETE